ncbi:GNAT family N-acetyltransferase [Ferrimonas pelagia]|uniref:GNAT family N-acetyltransferase n=1 Tax=Ferrimonas pelagia TaxID=1177826 RepID=A0ABP9EAR3_9GAMM
MTSNTVLEPHFQWYGFEQLGVSNLYAILQLRERVFQIEQDSLYEDIDGLDESALHLLVCGEEGELDGYLRLIDAGTVWKLGRIVLAAGVRGRGLGARLIQAGLDKARELAPDKAVKISAQQALTQYYQGFGFVVSSEPYDDGGVMHLDMMLAADS